MGRWCAPWWYDAIEDGFAALRNGLPGAYGKNSGRLTSDPALFYVYLYIFDHHEAAALAVASAASDVVRPAALARFAIETYLESNRPDFHDELRGLLNRQKGLSRAVRDKL